MQHTNGPQEEAEMIEASRNGEMRQANRNADEHYPLDDAAIATLAEIRESMKAAQAPFLAAMQGVVSYFCRQHKLQGQVAIAENGRELILRRAPQGVNQ